MITFSGRRWHIFAAVVVAALFLWAFSQAAWFLEAPAAPASNADVMVILGGESGDPGARCVSALRGRARALGVDYGTDGKSARGKVDREAYEAQARKRYELEPYILEFAGFDSLNIS